MKLVKDPKTVVAAHSGVSAKRASELVGFLAGQNPDNLPAIVKTFRGNDMPAAELALVEELLGIAATPQAKPAAAGSTTTKGKAK